jgi:hypothetical protein
VFKVNFSGVKTRTLVAEYWMSGGGGRTCFERELLCTGTLRNLAVVGKCAHTIRYYGNNGCNSQNYGGISCRILADANNFIKPIINVFIRYAKRLCGIWQ